MRASMMKLCCSLVSVLVIRTQLAAAQAQQDLDSARALWTNLTGNLPSNYTFEYTETSAENPSQTVYVIDVRNDIISRVYTLDVPAFDAPPMNTTGFPTVPALFNVIQTSITNGVMDPVYQYNTKYGYPEEISYSTDAGVVNITVPALTPYTFLENELEKNMALWNSYGQGTDSYSYVSQVSCFCESSYVTPKFIVVEDNAIVSTVDVETMTPSDYTYDTIPELFAQIQRSIDNFDVTIDVSYNQTFGFPTSITTNPEYLLMDAGSSILISNVTFPNIDNSGGATSPPSTTTLPPLGRRWCFGVLKFSVWCRVEN